MKPQLRLLEGGTSDLPQLDLVRGTREDPFTIGRVGNWVVEGAGMKPIHAFAYHDGTCLYLLSADDDAPVFVDGYELPPTWSPVPRDAWIRLGSVDLAYEGAGTPIEDAAPPSAVPPIAEWLEPPTTVKQSLAQTGSTPLFWLDPATNFLPRSPSPTNAPTPWTHRTSSESVMAMATSGHRERPRTAETKRWLYKARRVSAASMVCIGAFATAVYAMIPQTTHAARATAEASKPAPEPAKPAAAAAEPAKPAAEPEKPAALAAATTVAAAETTEAKPAVETKTARRAGASVRVRSAAHPIAVGTGKTKERLAADAVHAGDRKRAAAYYAELAVQSPDNPAFESAARIYGAP